MNRSRFDLLVFDWDGTLSDSLGHIVQAMQAAIADCGLPPREGARISELIGLGLDDVVRSLYPDLETTRAEALSNAYRVRWRAIPEGAVPLVPGTTELLQELRVLGYSVAIATGKGRRGLDLALRQSGVEPYIHASRCADEAPSKPHPQMLLELMQLFGTPGERTLMIGDSTHDLLMARNAGTGAVALNHAGRDPAALLEFGPLVCVPGIPELRSWLAEQDGW